MYTAEAGAKIHQHLLIQALRRLGDLLAEKKMPLTMTVCGGIVHLLHFKSRAMTQDVDAVFPVAYFEKEALIDAIKQVGEELGLDTNNRSMWFNDDISCFGLKTESDITIFNHPYLTLKSAKFEELLCLKLHAYRGKKDIDDAIELMKRLKDANKDELYKEIQKYRPRRGPVVTDQEFRKRYETIWRKAILGY